MATYGIYQVLDPLYVTPAGSVCSAKIVGGDDAGRIVVKVFNPPKPDPDEPNWEPKYFLDRAQVQRHVAAAGGAHWAPIYASGFTPEGGAYYVTDYHALTARKLIEGRVALDAMALHAVVSSVVAGLGEIRRISERAHANLKPSNVLLIGKGPLDELRAVLTDPGQDYKAEKDGEAGDLQGLGRLIHELVLFRPPAGPADLPAPGAPEWARLGAKAEAWRQLCSDLLSHPIPPRAATLAAAGKLVDGLAPPRVKVPQFRMPGAARRQAKATLPAAAAVRHRPAGRGAGRLKRRVVQLLAVLLLVGGGLGVVAAMEASAREELCTARGEWFGPLAAGLSDPKRREQFEADPHLRRIAEGVAEVQRAGVECRGGRIQPLGFLHYTKTRAALASLQQVERDLVPETWPRLQKLRDLASSFDRRGWQQPAGYVAQLIEGVRPRPAVSTALSRPTVPAVIAVETPGSEGSPASPSPAGGLAVRIDRVLRLQPIIEAGAASSDADWQRLDDRARQLERSDDPIVRGFGVVLRRESAAAVRLGEEGFKGLPSLAVHAQLADQILTALADVPADRVDTKRFTSEVVRDMDPAGLEVADVQVWLQKRPLYAVRTEEIREQEAKLRQLFNVTRTRVNNSGPDPAELQAYELEQKNVDVAISDFIATPFIQQDIARGEFDKRVKQVDAQIRNLDLYYHSENADDWLKNLAPVVTASDRLKNKWEAWVRTLHSEKTLMAEEGTLFAENKARTDTLRIVLSELDLLPQPPAGLSPLFEAAAKQHRENRLRALLEELNPVAPELKPGVMDAERLAMNQWFEDLQALAADFPIGNRLLTIDERPDEKWRAKDPTFWNDPLVRTLVKGDVNRIQRLQKLREAPRDVLLREAVDQAVRPEVRLASWQQLGQPRVTPPWPANVEELRTEGTLRGLVLADAKGLGEFERETLADEVRNEGPRRWRRFVEAITPTEARKPVEDNPLGAALSLAGAFNVDPVALQEISPPARFNVWLYFAYESIRERFNDKQVEAVVRDLRLAAKNLSDEERAAAVLAKLDKMDEPEPFAGRDIGEKVFRVTIAGLDQPMEFLRVEPKGTRPFYLGTREVTLGQFAGALAGKQLWDEALRLQWAYQPDRNNTDRRRGPRVWEWRDPASPRPEPAALWLTPDDFNDFPPEFHPDRLRFNRNVISSQFGGMPSEQHPMQYVSAQAALYYAAVLGFRLPSSAEWRAALDASGKTVESGGWNLRDQSWESFRAYAAKNSIPPERWPDRGAFPESPAAARRTAAPGPARAGNDSTLLFRPVPDSAGVFHDLVGNVAEYVCEAPNAFAVWPENGTPDGVKNFLVDTPGAVAVVGGSALSPRELPLDKPLPLKETHWGFSDVGLRLAFTAPARNKAERLKWVLAGEEYMEPARTVSADTSR